MKTLKLYIVSIIINLIPLILIRLIMGDTTGDENIGYYFYGIFFAISVLLNISYFFVNTKSEQKKIKSFILHYLSSFVFFVIGSFYLIYAIIITVSSVIDKSFEIVIIWSLLEGLVFFYAYFIINFFYAVYIKKRKNLW